MSRSQQGQVFNQTKSQQGQAFGGAENAYSLAQQDIGAYQKQLGQYAAENPFTPGGEYQTAQNQSLAGTANAGATAAGAALQGQARRTGINPTAAIGATEEMQRANTRNLSAEEAAANQSRIGQEAEYNKGVLGATAVPVGMETSIAGGQGGLYGHALSAEEEAAKTPSFMDTLGGSFAQGFGGGVGKGAASFLI